MTTDIITDDFEGKIATNSSKNFDDDYNKGEGDKVSKSTYNN